MAAGAFRVVLVGVAFAAIGSSVPAFQLADEPVALAWTPGEVQRAGLETLERSLATAAEHGELGCLRHCDRLHRIFERLLIEAREQTARSARLPWSLSVVRSEAIDAFALADGQLVISERLIDDRDLSDEALAFVLAHEMAHAILEHERQWLTAGRALLPRVERTVSDMYVELAHNFALLRTLEPVLHQAEIEADELGLLLAAMAGYAPNRQLEFMQNEVAEHDERRPLAATHPAPVERLERLQQRLPLAWRLHERSRASPRP